MKERLFYTVGAMHSLNLMFLVVSGLFDAYTFFLFLFRRWSDLSCIATVQVSALNSFCITHQIIRLDKNLRRYIFFSNNFLKKLYIAFEEIMASRFRKH